MKKIILWSLVVIVALYVGVILFFQSNQRNMQYNTSGEIISLKQAQIPRAEHISISVEERAPSLVVRGWYAPPVGDKPIIIYFNGNQGSFSEQYLRLRDMVKSGYGLVAFDYRGFPMSLGQLDEETILRDSLVVFDWAKQKGKPIVLLGRSLGTAPATYVASKRYAQALVLETPFLSAFDVAQKRYPILPVSYILKDKYLSRNWILDVDEPVFVGHGTADKVIPVNNGKELFALAKNGKELWIVEGGDHGNLWDKGLWEQIDKFLGTVTF